MPRDRDYWARKEHFEKYGYWPKDNKSQAQFKKAPEASQRPVEAPEEEFEGLWAPEAPKPEEKGYWDH